MSNSENNDGKVFQLGTRSADPVSPMVSRVERYWEAQRKGRLVPTRSEIDPTGLEGCLSHVFIVERISTGLARFRIAGTHMNALIGMDVRGMPVSAVFNGPDRSLLADGLEAVFDHPATLRLDLESPGRFGQRRLEGTMVFLPLRSDLGEISRALGVIVMDGDIGRTPRRFSILGEERRGLTGLGGPEAALQRAFEEETRRPVVPSSRPPRRTLSQHLRLVADNTTTDT